MKDESTKTTPRQRLAFESDQEQPLRLDPKATVTLFITERRLFIINHGHHFKKLRFSQIHPFAATLSVAVEFNGFDCRATAEIFVFSERPNGSRDRS